MAARVVFDPAGFENIVENGEATGFRFRWKSQYYRGITLSIVHDIKVNIDGEDISPEDISMTVNGETFTLDEMSTVVDSDYRWEFGDYAAVNVKKPGGLSAGPHHLVAVQHIAPSYMPFPWITECKTEFTL